MKKILMFVVVLFIAISGVKAQHDHDHPRNEIGLGVSGVYEINHKEFSPGFHAHYFRSFSPHSDWAWGGGVEYVRGDEDHFEIGMGVRYEPVRKLQLSLLPGISIADEVQFSLHSELIYEAFHISKIHLGPVIGYAWTKDHSHLSAGVHIAYAF